MNYPQTCTCIPNTAGVVYHNLGCPFASGYSIPYTVPSAPLPIPADLRAAPGWPTRVAAVEHREGCGRSFYDGSNGRVAYVGACDCDRDARIGRKIAAALKERVRHSCGSNVEDSGLVCPCGEWSSPVSGAWEASYVAHAAAAAARAFEAAT